MRPEMDALALRTRQIRVVGFFVTDELVVPNRAVPPIFKSELRLSIELYFLHLNPFALPEKLPQVAH